MSITIDVNGGQNKAADVMALVERTNKENPLTEDVAALEKIFDDVPALYRSAGNLNTVIFTDILEKLAGKNGLRNAASKRYLDEMKNELGFENSSFLEKMLIEEVLTRWLRLQSMENDHKNATYQEHSLKTGMYYDKRLHLAQSRYLKAIETLAKVRRMIARTQADGARMYKDLLTDKK